MKKTLHAAEQDRPDVAAARQRWKADQASLDPNTLVFIDETGTNTKMLRSRGRGAIGRRVIGKPLFGHWNTTTFIAGLRLDAITAPVMLDGEMNRDAFLTYVENTGTNPEARRSGDHGTTSPPTKATRSRR